MNADKGNSTVIINKEDYDEKIMNHLNDTTTYEKLTQDPSITLQRKVNTELMKLKSARKLDIQ